MAAGSPCIVDDGDPDQEEESIRALIEATKSAKVRSRIASEGTILPKLVRCLRSDIPLQRLISYFRLLRNLCAGEIASQDVFLEVGGPESVASLILRGKSSVSEGIERLGLQILGNVAAAGERHRSIIWRLLFSDGFLNLSRVQDPVACDALCMILCMCCCSPGKESRERFSKLSGPGAGLSILKLILSTAHSGGYDGDWIHILLSRFCFDEQGFSLLFFEPDDKISHFTPEQASLLRILSDILSTQPPEPNQISRSFLLSMIQALEQASLAVDFNSRGDSSLPTSSPAIDVLGYSLRILRDIAAATAEDHTTVMSPPLDICQLLLRLLRDLEAPSSIRNSFRKPESKVCPYRGFRRDLVSVIGNFCHGRREIQDEIRRLDGILLMLQQCVIDEENQFLREWGMLAVSYLLEGNYENQKIVADLQLQGPVQSQEITELGLRVDVEKTTGKVKLSNI